MTEHDEHAAPGLGVWMALFVAGCCLCLFIASLPSRERR